QQRGAKVFRVGQVKGRLDLDDVLKALAGEGITRLMVEGGPTLAASFVEADLVDEAVILRGEKEIGADGIDALHGLPLDGLTGRLQSLRSEQIGADRAEFFERG